MKKYKNIKHTLNERKAEAMIMYLRNIYGVEYKDIPYAIFAADIYHLNRWYRPINAEIPKKIFNKYKGIINKPDMDLLSISDVAALDISVMFIAWFRRHKIKYNYYEMLNEKTKKQAVDILEMTEYLCF